MGEQGLHRITDSGDKVFTFDKWRGGFKRYFQRKWENQGPYTRIIETPFDMPVYRVEEKVNYSANKRTSDEVSASTHHTLSLTEVGANNSSAIATISAYTPTKLEGGEMASFATLNTSQILHGTQLWAGNKLGIRVPTLAERLNDFGRLPGQSQSAVRQLARVELSNELEVRSIQPNVTLPQNVLYRVNAAPTSKVLIETDPDFTNQKRWLSSDYMFNTLRYAPETTQKRLGDGFYEQRLIREQINRLTGRNFVGNYSDFDSQYRGLMDAGITFAQKFNLRPGIALTPSQVAQLTTDIVWFESQPVSLGNGRIEQVLVPKIYALVKKGDVTGNGALLSGKKVTHKGGDFTNSGTVVGRELVQFDSASIRNTGTLSGRAIVGQVSGDVENLGGTVEADRAILLNIAGNFKHSSTLHTSEVNENGYQRTDTRLGRKGLLHVKGEDGELQVSANNIDVTGADILNEGKGRTYVSAKNKMSLGTLEVGFSEKMGGGNHTRIERVTESLISRVKGKGDVVLSGKDILSAGAELEAKNKFMALAENDLVLGTATVDSDFEEFHQTKSGSLAKTTKTRLDKVQSRHHLGTQVSGKDVILSAGHDVKAKGIQAIADDNLHVQAGHDVDIGATTNHFKEVHQQTKKTSGVLASGAGITLGSKSEKHHVESEGWTQSDGRSTLGSLHGNISVQAGNHAHVMGTDMITPNTNRIDVEAASVKVEAGKDIIHTNERHEYKQSGVSLAVSTPVTDMAQAAYSSAQRSQQVTNPKLKALYAMKAAEEAAMAAQNVGKVAETLDALRAGNMQQNGTTSSPSMKISLGYGSQKQTQSSESQSIRHQKSTLSTGVLNVRAHGEKVVFEGVDANAKLMALSGKQGIDIKGVKDEEHQRTENKSSGGSVGVFVGTNGNSYGLGIEGSANVAKGKSTSASERWQNSHLTADKIITNSEEGDLTLDAANLKAKRWEADIQNLTITSRQDTEKYESKQTSAGTSGSVAYGSGVGVSVNGAYSKAKVDYAQVNEQAGISVGEDGMDANIHNHTQVNAAIIESSAEESKNRFKTKSISTTDIENKSEIKTESASLGAGTGGINPMQAISSTLSLLGNTNESARSTTKSAISGNIQIETETPENLTALSRDTKNANQRVEKQDLQKVQERQEMAKVIGDITNNAISIATYNEREKINKLSLEKFKAEEKYGKESTQAQEIGKQITAIQNDIDGTYGIGSEKGMAIRAVTAALQAAAQNDTVGSLVALASPYLNQKIHEMTAGDTAKDKATNLMAHALLSAVEFQVTGKDPLTGAIAGVTGEATAEIIARAYGKPVSELTANEKENISTLSQLAGGLAAALTAKANGTTTEQGGNFLAATSGAETAKRAVENNYLSIADVQNFIRELSKAQKEGRDTKPILEKYKGISEENRQQLIACKGNVACETAHLHEMNTGAEELERNLGFFSRMTVYYPNDLNTANRIALSNLVERENAESFSKLSDTTKFGLNAMEAGTAIGLGAAAGSAKVGLSKLNSLISGKNKAYPTSGMDGYKRTNVGDEDYPEGIHFSMNLKNHLIQGEGINQRRGVAGGHNRENFLNTLSQGGSRIVKEESTNVDGITRIHYEIPRLGRDGKPDGTYKAISSPKTVYDPIKFSDHEMLEMGQKAVAKGYSDLLERNRLDPKVYQDSQKINGIKFHYYIDTETKGVTNVHPK